MLHAATALLLCVCVCVCALRSVLWSSCLSYCCCIALFHFVKRARSSLHAIEHSFLLHFPTVLFLCLVYVTATSATWVCVLHIFRYIHFSWLEKCLVKFFCKANQQLTRPAWRATHWTEHTVQSNMQIFNEIYYFFFLDWVWLDICALYFISIHTDCSAHVTFFLFALHYHHRYNKGNCKNK